LAGVPVCRWSLSWLLVVGIAPTDASSHVMLTMLIGNGMSGFNIGGVFPCHFNRCTVNGKQWPLWAAKWSDALRILGRLGNRRRHKQRVRLLCPA
jgi:hypothetical protein